MTTLDRAPTCGASGSSEPGRGRGDAPWRWTRRLSRTTRSVSVDLVVVMVARVLAIVCSLGLLAWSARLGGPQVMACLALLVSSSTVLASVVHVGQGQLLVREFARGDRANLERRVCGRLAAGLLLTLLTTVVIVACASVLGFSAVFSRIPLGTIPCAVLVVCVVSARGATALCAHAMRARGHRVGLAVCLGATNLIALVLTGFVVLLEPWGWSSVWTPVLSYAVSAVLVATGCLRVLWLGWLKRMNWSREMWRAAPEVLRSARQGLPFVVSALTSVLLIEGALLSSSGVLSTARTAELAAIMRCAVVLAFAQTSLGWVVTSRLVAAHRDRAESHDVVRAAGTVSLWSTGVLALLLATCAPFVLEVILGECTSSAVWTLRLVALAGLARGVAGVADIYLDINGGQAVVARIMALAAVCVLVAAPLLASGFGLRGVGIAYLLSSCVAGLGVPCACWLRWKVWLVPSLRFSALGRATRVLSRV